jgi:putative transposase
MGLCERHAGTSAAQASRPTTRTWKPSTPRCGSSASVGHWLLHLDDAREKVEEWRAEYNEVTPHSAIGDRTPCLDINGGKNPHDP